MHTQAQIPNSGFEIWDDVFNYSKPAGWWTNQDTSYTRIEKDTISVEGNYSLKMLPAAASSWQGCESRTAIRASFESTLAEYSVLTFYVKSIPEEPAEDSSVFLLIFGHTLNSDSVIGSFDWRTEIPVLKFEKVEIPLHGDNIDEISIFIYGGAGNNPMDGPCLNRSFSWIDGISIDTRPTVGPTIITKTSDFKIFPNPSTEVVYIAGHDAHDIRYELYSSVGDFIEKGIIGNRQLSIHNQGMYILKLYSDVDGGKVFTSKLVIAK